MEDWALDLTRSVRARGVVGGLLFALVYVAAMLFFVPASALTAGAGSAYGALGGVLFVVPVSVVGASLAFGIGRTFGRAWAQRRVARYPYVVAIDRAVEHNGFKIVVLMRLALVFPFNVLNYALGTSRLRFRDFFLGSLVGTVPGTFLYVYVGSIAMAAGETKSPLGPWRWALYGLGLAIAAATVALTVRYARRELERELPTQRSAALS